MKTPGPSLRRRLLKMAVLAAAALVIIATYRCRDPMDFKPPPDTLQAPPAPPRLISPKDSVIYNIYSSGATVYFYWEMIDSAEKYQINFKDTLDHDSIVLCDTSPRYLILPRGIYTWRVRAGSGAWAWTDWSETWLFKVMNFSTDIQVSPPQASVFVTDTFPYNVRLSWHSVGTHLLYTLNLYLDARPIQEIFLWDTVYNFSVPDSGYYPWYEWQIRTFDHHWVYPCSIITWPPWPFIVIRPGAKYGPPPLDSKWNSVIIKGKN